MDMKKTVTILSVMLVLVTVFFCVPVKAATYTGSPAVHKTASSSSSGVTYEINLDQYYPEQNADAGLVAGEVYTQVYYRITNSNDQAAYVRNTGFSIQWVTSPYIVRYETMTENLYLGYQNTSGSWYIYGDNPYSYSNGIVVPPHSSLYCVAYIVTSASVNGNTISSQAISSVSLNSHTVSLGNYPYGSNGQQLDEIQVILDDILDQLVFTGTITTPIENGYSYSSKSFNNTGYVNYFYITRQPSFLLNDEVEVVGNNVYHEGYRVIPIYYRVRTQNQYTQSGVSMALQFDYHSLYTPLYLPKINGVSYIVGDVVSQVFEAPILDQSVSDYVRLQMPFTYKSDGHGLLPFGNFFTSFVVYCICPIDVDPVFPASSSWQLQSDNTYTAVNNNFNVNEIFYIRSIDSNLQAFLDAYNSVNGTGGLSDNANELTEGLNNAHQAEQNYFSDNSQALAASGISNPNFEASDRIGINSAITGNKNQFGMLWNAIGAWRNVYVYAALLCLVTYLLRHKPWISGGRRHRREENG